MATATFDSRTITHRRGAATDDELARAAARGDSQAFAALYERHHLGLLSFSRHMLGRQHDAEDVVQHTFLAADTAFRRGKAPASVRAWLYTVARNRCISVIRARHRDRALHDFETPSSDNLAAEVEQRDDLRDLLADLRRLPDDQRAALLLAALDELSHAEVARVIGVRTRKVKALVFQARQKLMAAADARAIPCHWIRQELAAATGASRRRRDLREHVARCEACRAYAERVDTQRAALTAILPVVPTVALRESVLAGVGAGGATAATGAGAGLGLVAAKSTVAKVLAIGAVGGAAAGGGTVAVTMLEPPARDRPAVRSAASDPAGRAAAGDVSTGASPAGPRRAASRSLEASMPAARVLHAAGRTRGKRTAAPEPAGKHRATPAGKKQAASGGPWTGARPNAPRGQALGHAKQQARGTTAAGHSANKPERGGSRRESGRRAAPKPAAPHAVRPARDKAAVRGASATPKPTRIKSQRSGLAAAHTPPARPARDAKPGH